MCDTAVPEMDGACGKSRVLFMAIVRQSSIDWQLCTHSVEFLHWPSPFSTWFLIKIKKESINPNILSYVGSNETIISLNTSVNFFISKYTKGKIEECSPPPKHFPSSFRMSFKTTWEWINADRNIIFCYSFKTIPVKGSVHTKFKPLRVINHHWLCATWGFL